MSNKPGRTLGPAAFEAYMNFADSLKNGSNNDQIDRFKYRFAVKEGYIRPKKAITESAGKFSLGDFEKAFTGLVGAFLPHMDEDDQEILGRVCKNLDEKINGGDLSGAGDVIKDAMRSAGGDPDAYEDSGDESGECDDGNCESGECENGECENGECGEKCDDADGKDSDDGNGANSGKPAVEAISGSTPGFGEDGTEFELGDESGDDVDSILGTTNRMDVYPEGGDAVPGKAFDDASEGYGNGGDVDYDALADMILSDNGYGNMTTAAGGVGAENRGLLEK